MSNPTMSFSATVLGAKELSDACANIGSFAAQVYKDAINKTAAQVHAKAIEDGNVPHDTGTLARSIHSDTSPGHLAEISGNNIQAVVGTNLVYAAAQEFGTQGMTINSRSKTGKAFSYIGNIKPKHYMQNAMEFGRPLLTTNLSEAVQRVIQHLAAAGRSV